MASKPTPPNTRRRWIAHGSDWAQYEDLLIGDKEGLIALRQAIDDALAKGEGSLSDSDSEFRAVRVVDNYPDQDVDPKSWGSRLVSLGAFAFCLLLVVCLVYGCIRLPDLFK